MHELKLRPIYFDLIKNQQKIYEIRLNDEKRQKIDVGDVILFKKEPDLAQTLTARVEDLIYFKSFSEMCQTLPLEKVGFKQMSKKDVEKVYYSFYTKEAEAKYGVVAIKVKTMQKREL